ncbi:MAG TPA: hypothetical protein VGN08_01385 [Solirubrobacteraceae bacterium]|jgi:hypothetical protein
MKRIVLAAVASSLLALAAPGVASAHHGKHHRAGTHKRHAKRARVITFGSAAAAPTTPTTPTTPTPAGKVASFEKGVLTITLADGSTVSGKVTEETQIECRSATAPTGTGHDDQGGGDDEAGRFSGEHGGPVQATASNHDENQEQQGDDDAAEDTGQSTTCTPEAALVKEAVVGEAELKLSSAGAVWEKVEILQ